MCVCVMRGCNNNMVIMCSKLTWCTFVSIYIYNINSNNNKSLV
jgi:hypothetical protein